MKKMLVNYGGIVLFYLVIFLGVLAISFRMTYINNMENVKIVRGQ